MAEVWSDWEYYSDDYYDQESSKGDRKAPKGVHHVGYNSGEKRKILDDDSITRKWKKARTENIPLQALDSTAENGRTMTSESPWNLRWKEKDNRSGIPIFNNHQQMGKVALLKDWRERFKVSAHKDSHGPSLPAEYVTQQSPDPEMVLRSRSQTGIPKKHMLKAHLNKGPIPSKATTPSSGVYVLEDPLSNKTNLKVSGFVTGNSVLSPGKKSLLRKGSLRSQGISQAGANQATKNTVTQLSVWRESNLPSKERKSEDELGSASKTKLKSQESVPVVNEDKDLAVTRRSKRLRRDDVSG